MHPAKRKSFMFVVGGQPKVRHAPAVYEFLKIKTPERPG
jgi:hypothetical protein